MTAKLFFGTEDDMTEVTSITTTYREYFTIEDGSLLRQLMDAHLGNTAVNIKDASGVERKAYVVAIDGRSIRLGVI